MVDFTPEELKLIKDWQELRAKYPKKTTDEIYEKLAKNKVSELKERTDKAIQGMRRFKR